MHGGHNRATVDPVRGDGRTRGSALRLLWPPCKRARRHHRLKEPCRSFSGRASRRAAAVELAVVVARRRARRGWVPGCLAQYLSASVSSHGASGRCTARVSSSKSCAHNLLLTCMRAGCSHAPCRPSRGAPSSRRRRIEQDRLSTSAEAARASGRIDVYDGRGASPMKLIEPVCDELASRSRGERVRQR